MGNTHTVNSSGRPGRSGPLPAIEATEGRGVVDQLAAALQARIMSGEIPAGTRLTQTHLAAEYRVSRTPVREALRKLQTEGMVEVLPYQGALVLGPNVRDIREAYEVRAELEGLAAALAVEWITRDQLEELREADRRYQKLGEETRQADALPPAEAGTRTSDLFHDAVLRAADNGRLREAILDLRKFFPRGQAWDVVVLRSRLLEENINEHRSVLQAIERGDAEEARLRMRRHVLRTGELVSRWVERRGDSASAKETKEQDR